MVVGCLYMVRGCGDIVAGVSSLGPQKTCATPLHFSQGSMKVAALIAASVLAAVQAEWDGGSYVHDQIEADHGDAGANYHADTAGHHHYEAPKNVVYSPTASKSCCAAACVSQHAGDTAKQDDCQIGCDMWLHTSSLNWESLHWHPLLEHKCEKDCDAPAAFKTMEQRMGEKQSESHWTHQNIVVGTEAVCKSGCQNYLACM